MAEDALAFRILRLAKPALGVQSPLKFQLDEDMTSDSIRRTTYSTASSRGYKEPFADRAQLQTAIDACGVNGLMVLSKSFGDAYLGEVIAAHLGTAWAPCGSQAHCSAELCGIHCFGKQSSLSRN